MTLFFPSFFLKHLPLQDSEGKQTFAPASHKQTLFHTKNKATESVFSCAIFGVWFWGEGAAPLAESWLTHPWRREKEEPRLGKPKLLLL